MWETETQKDKQQQQTTTKQTNKQTTTKPPNLSKLRSDEGEILSVLLYPYIL